ncbi:hypothetical protein DENSPDRAFT_877989 [Dentipellis sp. KUC8613]|nr:hypothetical protein DENSPDRAFT_877989 [Dentipellis sp. KUC8613]
MEYGSQDKEEMVIEVLTARARDPGLAPLPPSLAPPPPSHAPVALFCAHAWPFRARLPTTPSSPSLPASLRLVRARMPPSPSHIVAPPIHRRSAPAPGRFAPACPWRPLPCSAAVSCTSAALARRRRPRTAFFASRPSDAASCLTDAASRRSGAVSCPSDAGAPFAVSRAPQPYSRCRSGHAPSRCCHALSCSPALSLALAPQRPPSCCCKGPSFAATPPRVAVTCGHAVVTPVSRPRSPSPALHTVSRPCLPPLSLHRLVTAPCMADLHPYVSRPSDRATLSCASAALSVSPPHRPTPAPPSRGPQCPRAAAHRPRVAATCLRASISCVRVHAHPILSRAATALAWSRTARALPSRAFMCTRASRPRPALSRPRAAATRAPPPRLNAPPRPLHSTALSAPHHAPYGALAPHSPSSSRGPSPSPHVLALVDLPSLAVPPGHRLRAGMCPRQAPLSSTSPSPLHLALTALPRVVAAWHAHTHCGRPAVVIRFASLSCPRSAPYAVKLPIAATLAPSQRHAALFAPRVFGSRPAPPSHAWGRLVHCSTAVAHVTPCGVVSAVCLPSSHTMGPSRAPPRRLCTPPRLQPCGAIFAPCSPPSTPSTPSRARWRPLSRSSVLSCSAAPSTRPAAPFRVQWCHLAPHGAIFAARPALCVVCPDL